MTEKAEEFWPKDKFPNTLIPHPSWLRRLYCSITGGHAWRKFLWGGIHGMFDCDCCPKCWKMRGPLPEDRDTPVFPCGIKP